jgi:hypothetical protein
LKALLLVFFLGGQPGEPSYVRHSREDAELCQRLAERLTVPGRVQARCEPLPQTADKD